MWPGVTHSLSPGHCQHIGLSRGLSKISSCRIAGWINPSRNGVCYSTFNFHIMVYEHPLFFRGWVFNLSSMSYFFLICLTVGMTFLVTPLLDTAGTHTIIITHYLPCRPAWPGYPSLGMSILTSLAFDSPIRSMKGWLYVSLFRAVQRFRPDNPPCQTQLSSQTSEHSPDFSWSYLLWLERGKIRLISFSPSAARSLTCIWRLKILACIAHFSQRIYLGLWMQRWSFFVKSHESD